MYESTGEDSWRQVYFCAVSPRPLPLGHPERSEPARAPRLPTASGPTSANYLFLRQRNHGANGGRWSAIFGRVLFLTGAFNPDVHLPVQLQESLLLYDEGFVLLVIAVAVFVVCALPCVWCWCRRVVCAARSDGIRLVFNFVVVARCTLCGRVLWVAPVW